MSSSSRGTRRSTRATSKPEIYNPSGTYIRESQAASNTANHDLGSSSGTDISDDNDVTYNQPEESEVGTSDSSEDELPFYERRPKANSLKSLNRVVDENWGPYLNAEEDQLSNPAWLSEHGYADGPPSDVGHVGGFLCVRTCQYIVLWSLIFQKFLVLYSFIIFCCYCFFGYFIISQDSSLFRLPVVSRD